MIWNGRKDYVDVGLLVMRVGFGLGFIFFHGWGKLVGGPERWKGVGGAMSNIGIDFGHTFFGFLASFAESIGGLLIAAGLFFRTATILLFATMLMASLQHILSGQGSPGHSMKNTFVALGLLLAGPGRYSLDRWISDRRQKNDADSAG